MKWALAKEKSLWYNWKVIKSSLEWSKTLSKRLAHVWLLRKMKGFMEKIAYRILCMSFFPINRTADNYSAKFLEFPISKNFPFLIERRTKTKNKKGKKKKTLTRCHRGLWPWEAYAS
jgi:hypothetical protein